LVVEVTDRKRWNSQEEVELKSLVEANVRVEEITARLHKTPGAVIVKCQRLGLQLPDEGYLRNEIPLPRDLPSVEGAARLLAGAMKASAKAGLNRLEVQRLTAVATITKTYKELIVDYAGYRDLERKVEKMERDNEQMREKLKKIEQTSSSATSGPSKSEVA